VINFGVPIRIFSLTILCVTLGGCATAPKFRAFSDTTLLAIGKTTPEECRKIYGNPTEADIQSGPDGTFEIYRYRQKAERWGSNCSRVLAIEFKSGALNGYFFGSSYPEDRTTFAVTNIAKIEWAASTKDEVTQLLGKPSGTLRCPSHFTIGDRCKLTGREIWVYLNFEPVPLLTPGRLKPLFMGDVCTITFDERGFVTDITKVQASQF
jgi:hypothetical protein